MLDKNDTEIHVSHCVSRSQYPINLKSAGFWMLDKKTGWRYPVSRIKYPASSISHPESKQIEERWVTLYFPDEGD